MDGWLFSAGVILLFLEWTIFLYYEPNEGKLLWIGLLAYCALVCFWKSGYLKEDDKGNLTGDSIEGS